MGYKLNVFTGNLDISSDPATPVWGDITGTLSDQTDLQGALDAKEPTITPGTTAQYYRGDKTFQTLDKTAVGLSNVDNTSDANKPVSTATQTALNLKIDLTEKAANNGVATLDAGGKIPVGQLPSSVLTYEGTWNAATNTPTLADGVGDAGMVYIVSVAGTTDFGSGPITFALGDWAVYSGTIWEKSNNSSAVVTVNGQTGVVVLDTDDISEGTSLYFTDERAQDAVGSILLDGTTIDFTYNDGVPSITAEVATNSITNAEINSSAGIDATKLADGSVSNTELQFINTLTSNAQTQINGKQPLDSTLTAFSGYNTNGLITQTAADTFIGRTITAGTGISVADGDGVAGSPTISSTITQYTDEMAQDAVGNILTDTTTIDFTYNDAGPSITADVASDSITNTQINSAAAIAYSKLNLSASIVNADVTAGAAISRTKLASGTADHVVINDGTGVLSSEAALAKVRGGTGIDNSSVTFPSTGVIVTEAGTQTLTNKTLSGNTATSLISGSGTLTLNTSGTATVPNGTTTLAGTSTTQTLTNKTVGDGLTFTQIATPSNPAASFNKIYSKSDDQVHVLTSAGTETTLMGNPMTTGGDIIYGGASGLPTRLANGSAGQYLASAGSTSAPIWTTFTLPTIQTFTSGTAQTYTTPAGVKYIRVCALGGGGGGGGSSTQAAGNGGTGGSTNTTTTFGSSLITANGGNGGGSAGAAGAAGGTATVSSPAIKVIEATGGGGGSSFVMPSGSTNACSGHGGNSYFGGGAAAQYSNTGISAPANCGGGGSGANINTGAAVIAGAGGGAGGYAEGIIQNPSATYTYTVGVGGAGGAAGTSGSAGGAGGSGIIIVEEYYI